MRIPFSIQLIVFVVMSKVFRLLEGLFSGNSYVSVRFDGNVIEIFNKSKDDIIRGKNWSLISKVLKDVIK